MPRVVRVGAGVGSYQRSSRSKPDQGLLRSRIEVLEADGLPVMTLSALNMIRRRLDAAGLTAPAR
jgi:hypothetical protein